MRTKKVNRYYCDFCKKSGCSSYHMKRHEAACTANPNRICRVCKTDVRDLGFLAQELQSKPDGMMVPDIPNCQREVTKESFDRVSDLVDGCPACLLAVLRRGKAYVAGWHYKDAQKAYWAELDAERYAFQAERYAFQ